MEISYQDINRKTIDRWVDDGWEWGKPKIGRAHV